METTNCHDRPDRVLIAFNTLINNKRTLSREKQVVDWATYITVAGNIIQGGGPAASISGPYEEGQWFGNILFKTDGPGDMPERGYKTEDPGLLA